jgi:hypothetical protein
MRVEGLRAPGERTGEPPLPGDQAHGAPGRLLQPDRDVEHPERLVGLGADDLEHPGLVERGDEHAPELGHHAHPLRLLGRLAIET